MADNIHNTLAAFRDTMLTAIARLEFQLRDSMTGRDLYERSTVLSDIHGPDMSKYEATLQELFKRIDGLEQRVSETQVLEREFMEIRPALNTRNILVPSVRSTPALAAAVAAASALPPDLELNSETSSESEEEEAAEEEAAEEEEVVEEEVEEEAAKKEVEEAAVEEEEVVSEEATEEESEPELKPIKIKKILYYIDSENNLYSETEDGYEQVGVYDPETKTIKPVEEEEAESEGAVEVEDFVYKGATYQRDAENNVYLDGEQVGTWNGKKIVPA
jgi:flagellar biosynthesis GTPase FlhF